MRGMNAMDGTPLDGEAHLTQSVIDILTTRIGSRALRRDYGSLLPELIDQPYSRALHQQCMGATAMALGRWEARLRLKRAVLIMTELVGQFRLDISGDRTDVPPGSPLAAFSLSLTLGGTQAPAA